MKGTLRAAAIGSGLGLAWGIAARVWMRTISTDPEFTWAGTLAILGLACWLGLGLGLMASAQARGRRPWTALLGLPGLALFVSPGMLFLPAFALGGLAAGHRGGRVVKGIGVAMVVLPALLLWWALADDPATTSALLARAAGGFIVLSALLAAGGSVLWRPRAAPTSAQVGTLRGDGRVVTVTGVHDRRVG